MNCSTTITLIAAALVKAQSEMGNAKKEATNPFFKKSYADINSVREAIMPALNHHGISVIQPTTVIDGVTCIETVLLHESGEFISSLTPVIVDKVNDAQRHGSGISYARRYALQSIANIGAEDDDANQATGKGEKKPVKQTATEGPVKSITMSLAPNTLIADWAAELQKCSTVAELMDVYNANKPTVEQPEIKALFTARNKALTPSV